MANWATISAAIVVEIKGLSLTGLTNANVIRQKLPWNQKDLDNGAFVVPVPERIEPHGNKTERIGYGVQVTFYSQSNSDITSNMDRLIDTWRKATMDHFRHKPLPGVAAVLDVHVEPGPVVDPQAFTAQYDATSFVLRCWTYEMNR